MMPLSQMLSPSWQMIRTLLAATWPNDSSLSASPKVTTIHRQFDLVPCPSIERTYQQ
jgi:hypothetical protein